MQFKGPTRLNKAPLMPMPSGFLNESLGVDIIGPLPETTRGNWYILVMVDYFTKWCEAEPIKEADAGSVAKSIMNLSVKCTPSDSLRPR